MSSSSQITDGNKNALNITLHKVKIISEKDRPSQYNLCIQFINDKIETEKITDKEKTFDNNIYSFPFNNDNLPLPPITFTALTSSWIVLSTTIASLSIPLTINKLNSQRQWYYLKNENDENILSILVSFSTRVLLNIQVPQNKSDLSINNQFQNTILHSLLNRTAIYPNSTKHTSYESGLLRQKNSFNVSNLYLDNSFSYKNNISLEHIFELLTEKSKKLENIDEKVRIHNLNSNLAFEKIKDREGILRRERQKLDEKVKRYKINQLEYEKKCINLSQNITQLERDSNRFQIENDIINYDKKLYTDINFLYLKSTDTFLPDKQLIIKEISKKKKNNILPTHMNKQIKTHIPGVDNPSKKSNSTGITSSNISEVSLNEYNPLKSHPISQIYLNTNENESIKNKIIEPLESEGNPNKRRTITNKSTLDSHIFTEGNATQRKRSLNSSKRRNSKGGYSNLCIVNQTKLKKQGVISITTHKSAKLPSQNKVSLSSIPSSYRHNVKVKFTNKL